MNEPSWGTLLVVLPSVTAFVGWVTNWAAVKMIFWPEQWIGIGPIGWQGVAFRHNRKFAESTADLAADTLLSPKDIAERIEPAGLERLYEEAFERRARPILEKCWDLVVPGLWARLPAIVQEGVVAQARSEGRASLHEGFERFQEHSHEFLDLRSLTIHALTADGGRAMAGITQKIGAKELRFIEIYGAVFGFLIGAFEALLWSAFQTWWLLPIVGAIVGMVTNWLAIQMIFRPLEPTRYLGLVTYQGLFPARQKEIARDYGFVTGTQVVTARNLLGNLAQGEGGERLAALAIKTLEHNFDERMWRVGGPLPQLILGQNMERMKRIIVEEILAAVPEIRPEFETYLEKRLNLAELIEKRMANLSKTEFEGILRGVFQEDEFILVVLGGVLGGLIGFAQIALIGLL